jgi:DNA invertase Pin-like site-specific DNA recombinase
MKNKRNYATKLTDAIRALVKPSDFILFLDSLEVGTLVVLYIRVSSRSQAVNLRDSMENLRREVARRGLVVLGAYREIVPGWEEMHGDKWGRRAFEKAVYKAQAASAVVVAESVDRFRRAFSPKWRENHRQASLTVMEMKRLMDEVDGVRLATLLHPDMPPKGVSSAQTKRGQAGKGNYGGRPKRKHPKKEERLTKKPLAIEMRKGGYSYRRIARELNVPWSTVRDWVRHVEKSAHPTV